MAYDSLPSTDTAPQASGSWHAQRFSPMASRTEVACEICKRSMWLPRCKVGQYLTCSPECRSIKTARWKADRSRPCETCGKTFLPRTAQLRDGVGRYCSHKCIPTDRLTSPENLTAAAEGNRRAFAEGRRIMPSGDAHPKWKGGYRAMVRRRIESGKSAESVRRYRKANPDKVREFTLRRRDRRERGKRLPMGTVKRIGKAQRWRCAICAVSIRRAFHLDHIEPLARDGKHEPRNVQLTCGPCNVRKNAKDPIDYMRSIGRLL